MTSPDPKAQQVGTDTKALAELDLAVAKIEARTWSEQLTYSPTRDGAEAMRLLEKYDLELHPAGEGEDDAPWWCSQPARWGSRYLSHGPTPAIAICRAVVALKEKPS